MKPREDSPAPGWCCGLVNTANSSLTVPLEVTGVRRRGSFWLIWLGEELAGSSEGCWPGLGPASLPCLFVLGAVGRDGAPLAVGGHRGGSSEPR